MINIEIGGVPEHFNLPWTRYISDVDCAPATAELSWTNFPEGSGAMATALDEQRLDMAMLLTEAAVTAIAKGGRFRIVSEYVRSPLIWGIHVPAMSALRSVEDAAGARIAISRIGSGSHLMSFTLARERGWALDSLRFVEVGTLAGAVAAFREDRADVFLWERFMTRPLVDAGEFRRIGEFSAPWPAFVACVAEASLGRMREPLREAFTGALQSARELRDMPGYFAERFGLSVEDVQSWLGLTQWAREPVIDHEKLRHVADILTELELIPSASSRGLTAAL